MEIRRAEEKDIKKIKELLSQVLDIHANLRPDIFIPGTTKYTDEELKVKITDEQKPVYVAADENDEVLGYAFCKIQEPIQSNNMIPLRILYVDDLCIDSTIRGKHIGRQLFEFVKQEAKRLECYEVTLNVWEGNESAKHFYEKMGMKPKKTHMELILE